MTTTTATQTTARCARCGPALTTARALRTGYGPTCCTKVRTAARKRAPRRMRYLPAKAIELIEAGGVVPASRAGVYDSVGTTGAIYMPARTGCTSPAGLTARHTCYPRIAVEIVEATRQTVAYELVGAPIALGLAA